MKNLRLVVNSTEFPSSKYSRQRAASRRVLPLPGLPVISSPPNSRDARSIRNRFSTSGSQRESLSIAPACARENPSLVRSTRRFQHSQIVTARMPARSTGIQPVSSQSGHSLIALVEPVEAVEEPAALHVSRIAFSVFCMSFLSIACITALGPPFKHEPVELLS